MNSYDSTIERVKRADRFDSFPDKQAFYIICIRDKGLLPDEMLDLEYIDFNGYPIVYTGKTTSLKKRRHFNGTARNSTLRKSLGNLLGLDREYYSDGKYKFTKRDEGQLTKWMSDRLIMYYSTDVQDIDALEMYLIGKYHPPLNLSQNNSYINMSFRQMLTKMRK